MKNHISEMQRQSCARILFVELGAWYCCVNKANLLIMIDEVKNKV